MQNGYLKVNVYTANRLIPVGGAQIAVYEKGMLKGYRVTNKSGTAETVVISAPDKDLSESPGNKDPYTRVDVLIKANGFNQARYNGVQIFAGETSVLDADLIPLGENSNINNNGEYNQKPQTL